MKLLLICCALLTVVYSSAQDKNRISGKAVQRSSGASIPNASVFVSGTSLGTITDAEGNFEIKGIPPGNFQLIVSSVGFDKLVYSFSSENLPLRLNLQMEPKVQELKEVTVEPFDPNGWQNWGKLFTENFLGTSYASRQSRIVNTKALRFRYNWKERILTVIADEPLEIVNSYLGYKISYELEEFIFNRNESTIFFYGYTFFKDLAENTGSRIQSRFIQRRVEVYNGSMSHFVWSLYHNRLLDEGFAVRRLSYESNVEKERVKKIMDSESRRNISSGGKTVMRLGLAPPADSMEYYRRVMHQPDKVMHIGKELLNADSLVTPFEDSIKHLSFPNFLEVIYKNGEEEGSYLKTHIKVRKPGPPRSVIYLRGETGLYVYPTGYYYPPDAIFSMEYWGWSEKVGHMLPIDYQPPGRKN